MCQRWARGLPWGTQTSGPLGPCQQGAEGRRACAPLRPLTPHRRADLGLPAPRPSLLEWGWGLPWSQLSGLLRCRASFSSGSAPSLYWLPSRSCLGPCSPPVAMLYITPSLRVRLREQLSVPTVPRSPSLQNSLCFLPELLSLRRPPCSELRGALPAPAQHLLLSCLLCGPTCCFRTQPRLPQRRSVLSATALSPAPALPVWPLRSISK